MTEENWTPGPWRVIEKEKLVGFAKYEIAWSDDDELVCDVVYHPEDAHLIAAAPELYEALNTIYQHPNCRKEVEAQLGEEVWTPLTKALGG